MRLTMPAHRSTVLAAAAAGGLSLAVAAPGQALLMTRPIVGPAVAVSAGPACSGQNAEVETATDPRTGVLYEAWIGCRGIGFARSTDGGKTFSLWAYRGSPVVDMVTADFDLTMVSYLLGALIVGR